MTSQLKDYYFKHKDDSGYIEKYKSGKNFYDPIIEDRYLKNIANYFIDNKEVDVLEIGYFSGRVNNKLSKYYKNITVTDISNQMIDNYKGDKFCLDWTRETIEEPINKYDFICNIGHQLSFSKNIENGIDCMNKFLNPGGIVFFDIWNSLCDKKFLPKDYEVETKSKVDINELLKKFSLTPLKIDYGFSLCYQYPKFFYLQNMLFNTLLQKQVLWSNKNLLSNLNSVNKAQNIYVIAKKEVN